MRRSFLWLVLCAAVTQCAGPHRRFQYHGKIVIETIGYRCRFFISCLQKVGLLQLESEFAGASRYEAEVSSFVPPKVIERAFKDAIEEAGMLSVLVDARKRTNAEKIYKTMSTRELFSIAFAELTGLGSCWGKIPPAKNVIWLNGMSALHEAIKRDDIPEGDHYALFLAISAGCLESSEKHLLALRKAIESAKSPELRFALTCLIKRARRTKHLKER